MAWLGSTPFSVSSVALTIAMNRISVLLRPVVPAERGPALSTGGGPVLRTRRTSLARIDTAAQDSFRPVDGTRLHSYDPGARPHTRGRVDAVRPGRGPR